MGENAKQVSECHLKDCPFYFYRRGKKQIPGNGIEVKSSIKCIKKYCYECSTFSKAEVKNCNIQNCVLFPFRQGKNPNIKNRKGNAEALKRYRDCQKRKEQLTISD